jgi:LysM repeat protein
VALKNKYHVVKKGDNLASIADKYKVSLIIIQNSNKKINPSKLFVGAKILIPEASAME